MTTHPEHVLLTITDAFLSSSDFNGITINSLIKDLETNWQALKASLVVLVRNELVGILFVDSDVNPHILRLGFEPTDQQLKKIESTAEFNHTCIYPLANHLLTVVDPAAYLGRPYTLAITTGAPQLDFRTFDLAVLEFYRNDPRYDYWTDDIGGSIYARDTTAVSKQLPDRDNNVLQTFGFAHDVHKHRAVAVFICYLANLSPEHQQVWQAREVNDNFRLHPDYYRTSILGSWPERQTIFTAFLVEQYLINQMASAMGRPLFFRKDHGEYVENRPQQFAFLVRPTLSEFDTFILLLDNLLSDNINKRFFKDDVPSEIEETRKDGKIALKPRGTISILDDWITLKCRPRDMNAWNTAIAVLRDIRKQRQRPAHSISTNVFDEDYYIQQRNVMIGAYNSVRSIRLLLAKLPNAKDVEIPDWLVRGLFWDY